MIAKMLQYQFLAFYRDTDRLLELLKSLGVVHIKKVKHTQNSDLSQLKAVALSLKQTRSRFEHLLTQADYLDKSLDKPSSSNFHFHLNELENYLSELKELTKMIPRLEEERFYVRNFGAYDSHKIKALQNRGLFLHLFSIGKGKVQSEWEKDFAYEWLFDSGRKTYFLLATEDPEPPKIKAQREEYPQRSLMDLDENLNTFRLRRDELLFALNTHETDIRNYLHQQEIEVQDHLQDRNATSQMSPLGFGKVILLQGWIPKEKQEILEAALGAADFYFEVRPADPKNAPPVLLRNNKLGKWFEPIGKLFSLPNYSELDLTPLFAPFFLLFFGFCLGDGGYGLILLIVLLALKSKIPAAYKGIWSLAVILEAMAIPVGLLAGTFFGINLLHTDVPGLVHLRPFMLDSDGLFTLALILGAVQIFFGLGIRMVNQWRQFGFAYSLSPFGWILLLAGVGWGYLTEFNITQTILSWSGVGLVIVFSDPKAGVFGRLGKGLWDLYGITGFFGDLLSYIRLFALGLAGSILGFVVNDIALAILDSHPIAGPIFFVIMLLVGHGLNIFIATLGAFVHPMRLTFVEFYKNAGFTGGGEAYHPLQKIKTETNQS